MRSSTCTGLTLVVRLSGWAVSSPHSVALLEIELAAVEAPADSGRPPIPYEPCADPNGLERNKTGHGDRRGQHRALRLTEKTTLT